MPKIPQQNPGNVESGDFRQRVNFGDLSAPAKAANQLGQQLGDTARRLSANELREVRFEALLQDKQDRANRATRLRQGLFQLNDKAFGIQQSFVDDEEPVTMVERGELALQNEIESIGKQIDNPQDREQFNLRGQAVLQSMVTNGKGISIKRQRDDGLSSGIDLQQRTLRSFSENPNISDESFAAAIDANREYYDSLERANLITGTEKRGILAAFDDKLGGIVREQDETLAIESGKHSVLLNHLLRVQNGFYRIAPQNVPGVIEAAIRRQSVHLNNLETQEKEAATKADKDFRIAMDLQDVDVISKLLKRPVTENEILNNMKGLVLEGFHAGVVTSPETVNAVEAEITDLQDFNIDLERARFTEHLNKAGTADEVDALVERLIDPEEVKSWATVRNGPKARKAMLEEAIQKRDRLVREGEDFDAMTRRELQLAESSLDALKTPSKFGILGSNKAENQKIETMKRILHLRVRQGAKPLQVLPDLLKAANLKPRDAADAATPDQVDELVPFTVRVNVLRATAPKTANQIDDQELAEMIQYRDAFTKKAATILQNKQADEALQIERDAAKKEKQENSTINQLLESLGIGE